MTTDPKCSAFQQKTVYHKMCSCCTPPIESTLTSVTNALSDFALTHSLIILQNLDNKLKSLMIFSVKDKPNNDAFCHTSSDKMKTFCSTVNESITNFLKHNSMYFPLNNKFHKDAVTACASNISSHTVIIMERHNDTLSPFSTNPITEGI